MWIYASTAPPPMCLHGMARDSFTFMCTSYSCSQWYGSGTHLAQRHTAVHSGMVVVHTWHKGTQTIGIFHPCQVCDSNFQSAQPDCSSCAAFASLRDLGSCLDPTV
jgi:hypothetical protein